MLKNCCSSGASACWPTVIEEPSAIVSFEFPRLSSTYLRPSARARADADRRVGGDRRGVRVELVSSRHRADGLPVRLVVLGVMLSTDAHAEAAHAHLVALHELGAVGQLRLELVGGHERQAVVGVVGQEDGHER